MYTIPVVYPNYARINNEIGKYASETLTEGYNLPEMSLQRAETLLDMAYLHEKRARGIHTIPSGKFSDAECVLWELFLKAIRAGKQLERGEATESRMCLDECD